MTLQLTATDSRGSVYQSLSSTVSLPFLYSPFGATASRTGTPAASVPGFNGERADPLTGVTHLGNGYRAYSPALQRFTAPDSESPFGVGGINPYAYCSNDPVNQSDPSGHGPLMWLIEGVIWGVGRLDKRLALTKAAEDAVLSAASKTEPVIWGVSAAGSMATGIASEETIRSNPEASEKLHWASLGLGVAASVFTVDKMVGRIYKSGQRLSRRAVPVTGRREVEQVIEEQAREAATNDAKAAPATSRLSKYLSLMMDGVSTLSLASDTLSLALAKKDPQVAEIFGYLSLGTSAIGVSVGTGERLGKLFKGQTAKKHALVTWKNANYAVGLASFGTSIASDVTSENQSADLSKTSLSTDWATYIMPTGTGNSLARDLIIKHYLRRVILLSQLP